MRRSYRADARIVLALLRWTGRPIFDFWEAEESGHLAGTTLVTYTGRAGMISSVAVAPPWRRQGWARRLLGRAHRGILVARRRYGVLEVLRENGPARALYAQEGYAPIRSSRVLVRE
ncbi:MAG: GNAT family N-acetyltransferase, partial [Thermoplasmata archaeon]